MANLRCQPIGKDFKMLFTLCQYEGSASVTRDPHDILADEPIALVIMDQLAIKRLELESLIRVGDLNRLEGRGADVNRMRKGSLGSL